MESADHNVSSISRLQNPAAIRKCHLVGLSALNFAGDLAEHPAYSSVGMTN